MKTLKMTMEEQVEFHRGRGWIIHRVKGVPVVFAERPHGTLPEGVEMKAWSEGRGKVVWWWSFKTRGRAEAICRELVEQVRGRVARKAAEREADRVARAGLKASDFWTVGDVVYTSWGYDQTNVEFFQVVEVKPKSVMVRQVSVNSSDHGQPGGGKAAPRRFEFVGPAFLCPVDTSGNFSAGPCWDKEKPSWRHHCSRWEGRAVYTSSDR